MWMKMVDLLDINILSNFSLEFNMNIALYTTVFGDYNPLVAQNIGIINIIN